MTMDRVAANFFLVGLAVQFGFGDPFQIGTALLFLGAATTVAASARDSAHSSPPDGRTALGSPFTAVIGTLLVAGAMLALAGPLRLAPRMTVTLEIAGFTLLVAWAGFQVGELDRTRAGMNGHGDARALVWPIGAVAVALVQLSLPVGSSGSVVAVGAALAAYWGFAAAVRRKPSV